MKKAVWNDRFRLPFYGKVICTPKPGHLLWGADYVLLLSILFEIIKLVTEQDYGIREVAKLHKISHALVIYWLKAFRERGLDGVKSPHTNLQTPKIVKPKMKKKDIEIPETTDFSPKAFKKLQRELALARAEIAYLKELEALDRQKQRQKKEKSLKDWSQTTR